MRTLEGQRDHGGPARDPVVVRTRRSEDRITRAQRVGLAAVDTFPHHDQQSALPDLEPFPHREKVAWRAPCTAHQHRSRSK